MSTSKAGQAELAAAQLMLKRMGISPEDLALTPESRVTVPTFAEYVPVVAAGVTAGTLKAYGSYWNKVVYVWRSPRVDEPSPSDIERLVEEIKLQVVARRNARGGRGAAESLIAALRCLYRRAAADGHIKDGENPALKVAKPRRLPSTPLPEHRAGGYRSAGRPRSMTAAAPRTPADLQPCTATWWRRAAVTAGLLLTTVVC
jgi:hypothetical protein